MAIDEPHFGGQRATMESHVARLSEEDLGRLASINGRNVLVWDNGLKVRKLLVKHSLSGGTQIVLRTRDEDEIVSGNEGMLILAVESP
jgi:hypothetical protein